MLLKSAYDRGLLQGHPASRLLILSLSISYGLGAVLLVSFFIS